MKPMSRIAAVLGLAAFGLSQAASAATPTPGFTIPPDLGSYAVLSCKDLKIAGNSVVTSEGLGTGSGGGNQGHVRSNGDVILDGSIEVHGDAVAGPGRAVRISGQPLVTGRKLVADTPFACAPIDLAALRTALEGANDNARLPLTEKGKPALSGANGRTLDLSGKDSLTLPAGRYLFDEIRLAGNSRLRVEGAVEILVTGAIDIKGGSHVNLDGNPYLVRLWSQGTSLGIASQSNVHAFLYAPAAAVLLSGQSRIAGGVQADRVDIVGGSRVRRVADDAPPVLTVSTPGNGQSVSVCEIPVAGTVTDGESPVQLTVNGAAATPAADGAFTATASLWTADPGLIEVVATDRAGNVTRVAVRVSIVQPAVALTAPAPGSLVGTRTVRLAGTSGTATEVKVNGVPAVVANGTFQLDAFDLGGEDGLIPLALVARNCGGSVTATAVLDLDTQAPVVAIDSPPPGYLFGASPIAVTGTVVDAHLTSVTVKGVTAAVEGQRFTAEGVALSEGDNVLVAVATDALGRQTSSAAVTVELDSTAPTVTITEPGNNDVVSTPQITVRGEASDPHLRKVVVNGVTATLSGGEFTASGVPLSEGENRLEALATDTSGNTAPSPPVVVVLDTLPPVLTLDAAALPALTGSATVVVQGTVSDPHLDKVTVNGVEARVTGQDWVAEGITLEEGANAIVARAVDTLGHASETAPAAVTRDTLPPQIAITEPVRDALLGSRTVTVRGTVADPHLERVTVLGIEATVTGGTFEATGIELPEGPSEITAHAADRLGHEADAAPVPVVVDTRAPVVRLDSPEDPLVATATVTVTGTVEEPHLDEVEVADLPATVAADGTFSVPGVPLVEGPNEIRAIARDTLGHEATSEPVLYVLDTIAPQIAITSPAEGETLTSLQAVVTGTASDTHLSGVKVNGADATFDEAAGTFQATLILADGPNVITVVATDRAGHSTETSVAVRVVLDAQRPVVTFDQPGGACLAAGSPVQLAGVFVDDHPQAMGVDVLDAAGARRSYVGTLSDGRWSVASADLGSADGMTTVLLTASDAFGNVARLSRSFRMDATAPTVRLTLDGAPFPSAGAAPVLFGRSIAVGVQVEDGATAAPPAAVLTLDGAPYAAGTPIPAEGAHRLVATATDCAGHSTSASALFTIDVTPPALRSTSPAAGARVGAAVPAFSGVSDPDLARATVSGRPAAVSAGSFTLASFPWREGKNDVAIELEDRAGHRATYQVSFTVRTAPLTVRILEGGAPIAAGSTFLRPVRPEIRASDSTATITATVNGAPFGSGTEIAQSGSYHLVATASDDWDRTARAEATFTLDLGAGPQIAVTSPADGAVVPGPTVRVEGTVSGDAPTVTVNGVAATVTNGTWAVASVPLEPDVSNTLVAIARDRRGRTATSGVTVRGVSGGPQVLILEPADGATTNRPVIDVAGVVIGGRNRSADGTVTVSGRPVELAADGTFRALDVPLRTGANTLTASVVDRESRTGSASVTVTADFTPPGIRFFARSGSEEEPLADGASFSRPITLVVEVADDTAGGPAPSLRLNGELRPEAARPRTEIPLSQSGGYVVAAAVEDAAGNETRAERSFVLDFGGCTLAEVTPAAGSAVAAPTVTLVGRSGGAASVKVRVPQAGGGVSEYAASLADGTFFAADVPLPVVGENHLELVCVDGAGAAQSTPYVIERLAAGSGPEIHITSPAAGALLSVDAVAVSGTVSSGAVTVNGLTAVVTPGSGLDTFRAATVPLSEGPNPLLARAVDAAGRTAEDRVVVHRDTQAPRVQITRPDNHSQVGVAGAGPAAIDISGLVDLDIEPNLDRVVVSSAQGSVTAAVDPLTGAFHAQGVPLDPAAGAGAFQAVTATATDTLGHTGASSVEVALDPAGPAIVLLEPADLTRFAAGATAPITVRGEAWAAPGTAVSVNGVDLDPATLPWEAAGADGRRHVAFTVSINLPAADGPFGIIARATDLQGRWAQDRRLLFRDTQALRVIEMVPADGATGVDGNALLLVLFSEPVRHASLDAADGLTLTRVSTGQKVVGTKTVAGQAVGFAPGAALAAGETYVLRAGPGITDVAGNALATPAEARFTVATSSTGGAPVLDALPDVVCADEIQVTGRATPGATLKARDGDLVFTGFADSAGVFTVAVPVTGSGYHLLAVWALDPVSGARSPETAAVVRIDCRAPSVIEARFDRATGIVRVVFSEDMDPATLAVGGAAAAFRLLDAEVPGTYQSGTLTLLGDSVAEIRLDTADGAWWRDRPVRLQAGPPAADSEGNAMAAVFETVFFPGGGDPAGGFLFGEAYDDTTGRPFAGATAGLFAAGPAIPGAGAPVASAVTDGRGRFVLAGTVPAGRYVLVIAGEETTRVYRRLSLRPATGSVPFDSRLTPLAEPVGNLDPVSGGTVTSGGLSFAVDPAALPGTAPVAVRLTARSGQGLPDFLPLGWTPAAAAEVRLEQDGAALPEQSLWTSGAAHLDLPLPAWAGARTDLQAVRYEPGTGRWLALPDPEPVAGGVRIALAGPGTVAVVVADDGPAPRPPLPSAAGEPLAGVDRPAEVPALGAGLALDPPVVGPTGRSKARVVARSADGATPWPSGLAVQAYLEERLVLTGGGEVLEAPFSADLVLYHPQLTEAEQGSAAAGAAGAMEFMVSPSPRAAQVLLEVGWENIRLFPFPEEVERGPLVGPDGGAVDTPEGVELSIPEGALGAKVPVAATLLTASELAALPQIAGYDTLAAVRLELSGATLARPATLSLPAPAGTPADSAASPRVILAELVEEPVDGRGSLARLAARTRREGTGDAQRVVAAPEPAGPLPLDGIVREGLYLLLAAHEPLGFATGFVRSGNGTPVALSRVTADGLGTGDLSRLTGRYAVPVSAGSNRQVTARHPTLDERGTGTIPSLAPGQVVSLDLTVEAVPPRVVSKTPQDGATNQPLATAVSILWSEALSPSTVTSSTLKLELAGADGESTGIFVDGAVTLVDNLRVVFAPSRPLLPGRTFRAHFAGGVADAGGAIYVGPPLSWTFSTSTAIVPGGQVHPEKFHIRVPVNGVAEIYGEPGALPGAISGQTPWAVTPDIEGPVADPLRETFQAKADGSFTGTVGHPPNFAVTLGSKVWVKVFDPAGTLAAHFRVGPFTTPDGLGFVAPAGEAVSFRSAQGHVVDVPAGAFSVPTLVKIRNLDPAALGLPTPPGLALGGYISLDFAGEARETLRVSIPAPAQAADGAQVFIGTPRSLPWGRRLQVLSLGGVLARGGQRYLSNDPSVQPEPAAGSFAAATAAGKSLKADEDEDKRTCQKALEEGLPKCFLQSLLMEFTLRSLAVFYYEQGGDWAAIIGQGGHFSIGIGAGQQAIANSLADLWTYVSAPHDWNGGFVLPVLAETPLELVRRDMATGWVLGREVYDPVSSEDGLIDVGFLSGGEPARPVLIDARPFQVIRFEAPEPLEEEPPADGEPPPLPDDPEEDEKIRLTLEVEARVDPQRQVTLEAVEDFPLPKGSSVALFDLEPEPEGPVPPPSEEAPGPPPSPEPPIAGPSLAVCDEESPWKTEPFEGGRNMLALVGPGGLDSAVLGQLELQFDRPLEDVTEKPVSEVAKLLDLGPLEEGCESSTAAGYPKPVPFELDQLVQGSRLVFRPSGPLPAGHRFRLEILPEAIAADGEGTNLTYWETAPTRFEFATREVPGEPIAGMPEGPALGTTSVARDMVKLGNLLLVASETGDLAAIDVSRSSEEEGLRHYAVKNKGLQSATRSLATDGHNRVFYSGLFGPLWAVKALRLEDIREADVSDCVSAPEWAQNLGLPCFEGVEGSVRIAYALGSQSGTTASEWLAAGTLPEATPMDLSVLTQDEKGEALELSQFYKAYTGGQELSALTPDSEGIYTFDLTLKSTFLRSGSNESEPSLPPDTPPAPPIEKWRESTCEEEEDYDRFQRVTVDNLTTGQTWSLDIENVWPADDSGGGNGSAVLEGVRARPGDELRVRYNLRALGYLALTGSGITIVDLNRFYGLQQTAQSPGGGQCGRRLGKFEGQDLEFPSCAPESAALTGIAMTPSVVAHSKTGCGEDGVPGEDGEDEEEETGEGGGEEEEEEPEECRGDGFIDVYSPLSRIGAVHTRSTEDAPGGVEGGLFDPATEQEGLQLADLAACIQTVDDQFVLLRDVALANDVKWFHRGIDGEIDGTFRVAESDEKKTKIVEGDLLFVSLGNPGIYVFDVSSRSLETSPRDGKSLIGRLHVPGHSAFRLQVDPLRGLLFAGGTDAEDGQPVIDVWDLSTVNGAPGLEGEPTPVATLHAPWSTNQLGIDSAGTGLLYTWDKDKGPKVVPFDRPRFVFSGIYRPEDEEAERGFAGVQKATARFVPLGVPVSAPRKDESEEDRTKRIRKEEEKASAAFKVRVALPGSLGPELLAKVQSLRVLPAERHLGQEDLGAVVLAPGGPGWPDTEQLVRLRRVGLGEGEEGDLQGEGGPLGTAYQLYESVETVLLLADPRARGGYTRQDDNDNEEADEKAQCRRCDWPGYLPDPEDEDDPRREDVEELLAGRYVRVFLFAPEPGELPNDPDDDDPDVEPETVEATRKAIELFTDLEEKYPLPTGAAEIAGAADAVPSPLQASLAEPAQNPAVWSAGEAGVAVALPGGELLLSAVDREVPGRVLAVALDRTYRSGVLGYGPLGSAGWSGSLFAHLRELPVTGEVEYHDGMGRVWRFYPSSLEEAPEGYEKDEAGSYYVPKGLFLRLQKLSGGQGFRLLGRQHDVARFDAQGRLVELSDRHHQDGAAEESAGEERGSRIQLRYDPFGQLATVVDDLGRRYEFEYYDDPRPEDEEGDGPRFGLLEKVTDFAGREVAYEYDEERRLTRVKLPEVRNKVEDYGDFSYEGDERPALEYRYDSANGNVTDDEGSRTALLHGEFARLRLSESLLPGFIDGVSDVPRARFEYEEDTGRLSSVGFPTPQNQNNSNASVEWSFTYTTPFPVEQATIRAPWDHRVEHELEKGRVVARREELFVYPPNGEAPGEQPLTTRFTYEEDGRLLTVDRPDGSRLGQCYADGKGGEGCEGGAGQGEEGDRLAKANVVRTVTTAVAPDAQGTADYVSAASDASYQEDNVVTSITDGEGRPIDVAVPQPAAEDTTTFSAEQVSSHFKYDRYGRVEQSTGGGAGGPILRVGYGADHRGRQGGGLVKRVEQGTGSSLATWQELFRDRAGNVERVETSEGSEARAEHDEWDRAVRTVAGEVKDGRLAAVGAPECDLGEGAITERAFDAAGHLVRERHLQDYVDLDGGNKCRFVETRYEYNAREQLVAVEQTHLATAAPGQVDANPQPVKTLEYDEHGRVASERTEAVPADDLLTVYAYDPAGRVESVRTGDEGARRVGYDALSRVVFATDGDEGAWSGRYDAWGRLYQENQPTGALVRRRFGPANNLLQETVTDGEGTGARVLADAQYHVTSFGALESVSQVLAEAVGGEPPARRVTQRVFDGSGRMTEVWSGPPVEGDPTRVARDRARRELRIEYEPGGGRVQEEKYGGDAETEPLYAIAYRYDSDSEAPWPNAVIAQEAVPGKTGLTATLTTTYRRDAFGRPVEESRSDGSVLTSVYDRSGGVIRATTGAGTQVATTFDGRNLPLKVVRPNGRGFTLYAYGLDGALLRQSTRGNDGAELWATSYDYDATRRPKTVTYADGSTETFTYNADSTVRTRQTRDGLTVTYDYDAANRLKTATPSAGTSAGTLLDAGDSLAYDELSRPTRLERGRSGVGGYDAALAVSYPFYDLGSRPASEVVGARAPFTWKYDTWSRPVESVLPVGPGRNGGGSFQGFTRRYDTLDRLSEVSGLGANGLSPTALGATWEWGGAGRLYAINTKGLLGTAARYGYIDGAGPQLPGDTDDPSAQWKLGTVTWGGGASTGATAAPEKIWGQFGFGWRGHEGTPEDGAKLGRKVLRPGSATADLFAGLGWSYGYDAGVRLSFASAGSGDLEGQEPPPGSGAETFRFGYGEGDELERIVRESTGQIAGFETGDYGRILSRNGAPFTYDGVGRRLDDDRFVYRWDWRGQLVSATVKDTWPDSDEDGASDVTPFAGHQVRYEYDAAGRLTHRWHYGKLPEGTTDDAQRPFIEKRVFVWEGSSLAAEAAYNHDEALRWRKTYVPGPSGLDDAVQVIVEDAASATARTYTLLRDELGTVLGLVAEDEGSDPANPPVPVRYRYTPYGEAHAESGPELLRARFDGQATEVQSAGGTTTQTVADETAAAAGSLVLDWTLPLDNATLPANLLVERLAPGIGWAALSPEEVAVGPEPTDGGISAGGGGPPARLLVLARSGWLRGTSYRVRLTSGLTDDLGRRFGRTETLEWRVPEAPASGPIPAITFDKKVAPRFETWEAATDTATGRFPGGQTALFQGLWTDPVTGVAYARARWYDARNASWLSEDPLLDIDSPNLYAFVGHQPHMGTDPFGELCIGKLKETAACQAITGFIERNVLGVDEQAARDYGDAQLLIAKFKREHGRAPREDEVVLDDPEHRRYLSGDGRWKSTTGEITAAHDEFAIVGIGLAARGGYVAVRAAGGGVGRALGGAALNAGDELAGEITGVSPSVVASTAKKIWARSGVFNNDPIPWTATRPRGTQQTYEIYQRTDIDWNRVRAGGDKRFLGKTNAEAARAGLAPELSDGSFATLHHVGQDARGALVEASTRYHGVGKPGQQILHSQYGRNQPHPVHPVDRNRFGVDTREYWQWRVATSNPPPPPPPSQPSGN
ncbi:MAG TPA: Ig-like domain-containing protein [Thermoanaerobaculia bacterium]|nr:Ig-like domain-containing protein [Thermoanaerobaculia bacterium]